MSIPFEPVDMRGVVVQLSEEDEGAMCARWKASQDAYDEHWKKWLAQYDDAGHLKPGIFGTRNYIPNRHHSFLSKTEEERAAFIVSEKKRLGVL